MDLRGFGLILGVSGGVTITSLGAGLVGTYDVLIGWSILLGFLGALSFGLTLLLPYAREEDLWARLTSRNQQLEVLSRGPRARPAVTGRVDGCGVRIEPFAHDSTKSIIRVFAPPPGRDQIRVVARPRTLEAPAGTPTHDPALEGIYFEGSVPELICRLDAPTRALCATLMTERGCTIEDGAIVLVGSKLQTSADRTHDAIHGMAKLARRLFDVDPASVPEALMSNARADPLPAVRANNLIRLFEYYPAADEAIALARTAAAAEEPYAFVAGTLALANASKVALESAGPDRSRLFGIASDERQPEDLRAWAVRALRRLTDAQTLRDHVSQLVFHGVSCLPETVLRTLARLDALPDVDQLREASQRATPAAIGATARAIGRLGSDLAGRLEPFLLTLLESNQDATIEPALVSLGEIGRLSSVEAILPLGRKGRHKMAAGAAIRRIQEREGGPEAGLLSMSSPSEESGRLELLDAAGSLSEVPD